MSSEFKEYKVKLSSIAKDFGLPSIDISQYMEIDNPKTGNIALNKEQLNTLFNKITLENQVEDMEKALKLDKEEFEAKKLLEPKQQATKTATKQTEVKKSPETKPTLKKQVENKSPVKKVAEKQDKKIVETKQNEINKQIEDKKDAAAKKQAELKEQKNKKFEYNPEAAKAAIKKPVAKKPEPKKAQKLELTPKIEPSVNILTEEVSPIKGKIIDNSRSDINLSKYDEKSESLVSIQSNKFNQTQTKQKIVKKADSRNPFGQKKRMQEQQKHNKLEFAKMQAKKTQLKVLIPDEITVSEFAIRLKKTSADVIKSLMKMGVMATLNEVIDFDTASLIAMEFNAKIEKEIFITIEEKLFEIQEDNTDNQTPRSPVVVVMGHVDHGKTSLLDAIRNKKVVDGEAGGITQHIGAYQTSINGKPITFLDTPGHAAFTSMRARGASITDIAILVVAADDGVMPQTIEAINHAKAANTPIIVAVNKMDKEGANPEKVLQQLTEHEIVPEDWGGDTIVCQISAKNKEGLDNLLEMVLLVSDMQSLKANPDRRAKGAVIEAKLDKGRGPVATVLVQNGTLKIGDVIIAGTSVGRVRAMTNDLGQKQNSAGPSTPVEIIGLSSVPNAGDIFHSVEDERMARELAQQRLDKEKTDKNNAISKVTLDNIFDHIQEGNIKSLNVILKADVHGSSEALKTSLEKITCDEVRVRVIHSAVGAITESDVMLAAASGAIIVGFNVRPERAAADSALDKNVDMRMYSIIYQAIDEMEQAMKGMLTPIYKETILGHAEVRQTFKVSGVGTIAGCSVIDGKIVRNAGVRVVRDGIVIHEGELDTLKRFKDDAKEVTQGFECGISIVKFNDLKNLDIIEAFIMEEIKR